MMSSMLNHKLWLNWIPEIWLELMTLLKQKEKKGTNRKRNNDKSETFQLIKKITSNRNSFKLVKHKLANKTLDLIRFCWGCVCVRVSATNLLQVRISEEISNYIEQWWPRTTDVSLLLQTFYRKIFVWTLNIKHFVGESEWNWNSEFMLWKIEKRLLWAER